VKVIDTSQKDWRKKIEECMLNSQEFVAETDDLRFAQAIIKTLKNSSSNTESLKFFKLYSEIQTAKSGGRTFLKLSGIAGVAATSSRRKIMGKVIIPFELTDNHKMQNSVDISIRHIVEEFNKSKHIKTVFSCGGHRREYGGQVYIAFEMNKEYIGAFLEMAFSTISSEMNEADLMLNIHRGHNEEWPKADREQLSLRFLLHEIRYNKPIIKLARDYFHRLSLEVSARL